MLQRLQGELISIDLLIIRARRARYIPLCVVCGLVWAKILVVGPIGLIWAKWGAHNPLSLRLSG